MNEIVCLKCFTRTSPDYALGGSGALELVLWLLFLLPGLLYSLSRITNAKQVCPTCKSTDVVPSHTSRAQELIKAGKAVRGPSGSNGKQKLYALAAVNAVVAIAVWAVFYYVYTL